MSKDLVDILPIEVVEKTTETDPIKAANDQTEKALAAIKARARKWEVQADVDLDVDFYCVVVFQSRRQREELFAKLGWDIGDKFIDGLKFADKLGIGLTREAWVPFEPTPTTEPDKMIRMDHQKGSAWPATSVEQAAGVSASSLDAGSKRSRGARHGKQRAL